MFAAGQIFLIFVSFTALSVVRSSDEQFHEELLIKPLPNGHIYTHFQFTTTWDIDIENESSFSHFRLFPKSLGETIAKYSVQELHLTMTQGLWRYEKWGYPVSEAPPGAELWVWFLPETKNIDRKWSELSNALSGQFCASLNFMDGKSTVLPKWSFRPHGAADPHYANLNRHGRYSALPRESVCTENLTPWKKLLPCSSKVGLAALFDARKLYDSDYHSLGLHVRPVCKDAACSSTVVEFSQTLAEVFEPARGSGKPDSSLKDLFGRFIPSSCPLASSSKVFVDITPRKGVQSPSLSPAPTRTYKTKRGGEEREIAEYNLPDFISKDMMLNVAMKYNSPISYVEPTPPQLYAHRFSTGYGQEQGGMMSQIYNTDATKTLTIIYMETIPWFIRVFFHTIKIETNGKQVKPSKLHYVPGKDREQSYHLEVVLTLPPKSRTTISLNFERALLKWTEYPPDANHGFYINAAVISTMLPSGKQYMASPQNSSRVSASFDDKASLFFLRIHTETLLVSLPVPDFSMPYNVICLACTVVAIAFGSLHNLATKLFQLRDPNEKKPGLLQKIKDKLFKRKNKTEEKETEKNECEEKEESASS
ncbi:GPI transamidase component PIG-T-like [Lineus longissimus]|uniref:GPI transamidase component PIG-T-like n=1 Tax=Lineus longissimus TaxID=88925 RepID=UPI00315D5CCD